MPEGPEVKRIVERLNKRLAGEELRAIHFENESYCSKQVRDQIHDLRAVLDDKPLKIDGINCKGKFIWFTLNGGEWEIWHTLGMSGTWRTYNPKNHVMLKLETLDGKLTYYRDTRRFGTFKIFHKDNSTLDKKLATLGPDMLNDPPSFDEFVMRLRKKNHWNITKALMDQKVVSGIGNYIKAEVLYRAKISPWHTVEELTDDDLRAIYDQTRFVIQASYDCRGATIRDYVLPDGSTGDYRFEFECYSKRVSKHGHKVIQEETPDRRRTWWCPDYQS
ncbi:MAG: Fpg/Nei family DNA glycosylase [Candidatus Thorarchaeota archaeon]